jgi:hypothetical protein
MCGGPAQDSTQTFEPFRSARSILHLRRSIRFGVMGPQSAAGSHCKPGAAIDGSDPDGWSFPIGTRFWKELPALIIKWPFNKRGLFSKLTGWKTSMSIYPSKVARVSAYCVRATHKLLVSATEPAPLGDGLLLLERLLWAIKT